MRMYEKIIEFLSSSSPKTLETIQRFEFFVQARKGKKWKIMYAES